MPFHSQYADGTHRPLFRGWLHGIATCIALPLLYTQWNSLPAPAIPGILAICATLTMSSLVHLYPWKSTSSLEMATRMDKTSILFICGCSCWGPQLLEDVAVKPDFWVAVWTVAVPTLLGAMALLRGAGPAAFGSTVIPFVTTLYFYSTVIDDLSFVWHELAKAILYSIGFLLYLLQVGGDRRYWGYQEWMHLCATIGFLVNIRGLLLMSTYSEDY